MTNPIYTLNVISDEMIKDFKLFLVIWVDYSDFLWLECYEFDKFGKIIDKIKKNYFNFNEEEMMNFNELLRRLPYTIYICKNAMINDEYDDYEYDDYDGETLYDDEDLILCHKIKNHLRFLSEPVLDYKKMKENNAGLFQELCQSVFNPERINRLADNLGVDFHDYLDTI